MPQDCPRCRELEALIDRIAVTLANDVTAKRRREKARLNERRDAGIHIGRPLKYDWLKDTPLRGGITEVASTLGISRSTVHYWTRKTVYRPRVKVPMELPDLPVKELARRYGIATSTLYRMLRERRALHAA